MKKNDKKIRCFVYLSVDADMRTTEMKEKKQLKYIKEYAKAHNCEIVKIYHKDVLGQGDVNRHFLHMVSRIRNKDAEGIVIANMGAISTGVADAYHKVGLVVEAGGQIITVDEGNLNLHLQQLGGLSK